MAGKGTRQIRVGSLERYIRSRLAETVGQMPYRHKMTEYNAGVLEGRRMALIELGEQFAFKLRCDCCHEVVEVKAKMLFGGKEMVAVCSLCDLPLWDAPTTSVQ